MARVSPRSRARADEHAYRLTGGARPIPRQLREDEVVVGMQVRASGRPGLVESIAWSRASESKIYVVAHDPRIRLIYRLIDLTAVD